MLTDSLSCSCDEAAEAVAFRVSQLQQHPMDVRFYLRLEESIAQVVQLLEQYKTEAISHFSTVRCNVRKADTVVKEQQVFDAKWEVVTRNNITISEW